MIFAHDPQMDIAYCAGLADGESYIAIHKTWYCHYQIALTIAMRDKEPLDKFQSTFGIGTVKEYIRNGKPLYQYSIVANDAYVVLSKLTPFLTGRKKELANLCIEYRDKTTFYGNSGNKGVPKEEQVLRDSLYKQSHDIILLGGKGKV